MTTLLKLLMVIFPRSRRPFVWTDAWPVLLFVIVFVVGLLAVETFEYLTYTRLGPVGFLVLAPWVWWMSRAGGGGLTGWRASAALWSRFVLLGLLVVILCEPRAVRKDDSLSIIFAVDVSSSITAQAVDSGLAYALATQAGKPDKDEAGLVFFGQNAAVELPPGLSLPFEAQNVRIDRGGTDLGKALSLSAAMLPDQKQGRIVLITDGVDTVGDLETVLDDLNAKDISVDVLPLGYKYDHEVWLERLELPESVKMNQTYEAAVILSSLTDGEGRLVLQQNGKTVFDDTVSYTAGKNRYAATIRLDQPGYYEYTAHIETAEGRDNWAENNVAISSIYMKGKGRVLVVTDPAGDPADSQFFIEALRMEGQEVETLTAYGLARDALALLPYDSIVFANVGYDAFDDVQIQAVHDAVFNQGTGFLMIGGNNSFGPGGYNHTLVENMLPVTMDLKQKKIMPKGALAIILHTCEFLQGNTWGKRITKQAIKVLSDEDEVGVLVYGYGNNNGVNGEQWLFPLTPAAEYDAMVPLINNAQIGDMPDFHSTMRLGLDGLAASDAMSRHMIIISDGDPSMPSDSLIQEFIDKQVSISMVAVFPHGGNDISKMQAVANVTKGKYYKPASPNELPSIFIKEAKTLKKSMIQNKTFVPVVKFPSPILKGIDDMPELHGYVMTSPKPDNRVQLILDGPEADEDDPILAVWRYGLGSTAAFTADLSNNWAKDWLQWERYRPFVKQLLQQITRINSDSQLRLKTFAAGGQGVITVEDFAPGETFMQIQAQVESTTGESHALALKQVGPGRYEGRFPLAGEGRYQVTAAGVGPGREERVHGGFVVPYSQEFLRFRADPIVLEHIAKQTSGRMLKGDEGGETLYSPPREPRLSSRPIVDWLLLIMACLIPLDVALRRVQIDWELVRGWFKSDKAESGETMSALLKRKQSVASTLNQKEEVAGGGAGGLSSIVKKRAGSAKTAAAPSKAVSAAATTKTASQEKAKPVADTSKKQDAPESTSTTSRLLAAKRRAKGQDDAK